MALTIDPQTARTVAEAFGTPELALLLGEFCGIVAWNGPAELNAAMWMSAMREFAGHDELWTAYVLGWNRGKQTMQYGLKPVL